MSEVLARRVVGLGVVLAVMSLACGSSPVDTAMNRAMGKVGEKVGERVGEKVADKVVGLTPDLIHTYTMAMFQVFFYHGGYALDSGDYKPGQYTKWKAVNVEQGDEVERSLLKRYDDGKEWWRIESRGKDGDGKPMVLIMEALLGPEDKAGSRQVRRMRAHFPNEPEPREVPITEEQAQRWTVRTTHRLTKESMQGMEVGTKSVTVPAGTFSTKHLKAKGNGDESTEWFLTDKVPGGIVKYQHTGANKERTWEVNLVKYGDDATTSKLGIDLSKEPGA